jgi:hypothetical protein
MEKIEKKSLTFTFLPISYARSFYMQMRARGVEPPPPIGDQDLNLARLPIPPRSPITQTQNSNIEIRNNIKTQMLECSKLNCLGHLNLVHSNLFRISNFVLRAFYSFMLRVSYFVLIFRA